MMARISAIAGAEGRRTVWYFAPLAARRTIERLAMVSPAARVESYDPPSSRWLELGHHFFSEIQRWRQLSARIRSIPGNVILVGIPGSISRAWMFVLFGCWAGLPVTIYTPNIQTMSSVGARFGAWRDWINIRCLDAYCKLVLIQKRQREEIVERGMARSKISVLENFTSPPGVSVTEKKRSYPLSVGVIGRISFRDKGQDLLIDLSAHMKGKHEYHIFGDGPDLQELKLRLGTSNANRHVNFHGWVADPWERNFDAVLITSRTEGVPLVMIEAILRGIPVISTDLPEVRNLLPEDFRFDRRCLGDFETRLEFAVSEEAKPVLARLRQEFWMKYTASPTFEEISKAFET